MWTEWLRRWRPTAAPDDLDLPGLFSQAALLRAWAQVRANRGAAGGDGVTLAAFERALDRHLAELQGELVAGRYRPQRVTRVFVPAARGKQRGLALWAVRDRVVQRLVYDYMEPLFEPMFLGCSYGFRPGRGIREAVAAVAQARDAHQRWVLDGDIQDCFDSIDPALLLRLVARRVYHPAILHLVRLFLHARIFNALDERGARAGVSQGSALSPLLCNIYLHEFDQTMVARGYTLVRYADDWVILCRRRGEAEAARHEAERALRRLRLTLHPRKTALVHIDQGFKFLGHFFVRGEVFTL